jgi:pimeloyl-ACP methyl ester carboxylesterase
VNSLLTKENEMPIQQKIIFLFFLLILLCIFYSAQIEVPRQTETITFQSGNYKIVGELRIPKTDNNHPLVIMVHGDGPAYRNYFAKVKVSMLRAGYATLMWDKPGFGESTGNFSKLETIGCAGIDISGCSEFHEKTCCHRFQSNWYLGN